MAQTPSPLYWSRVLLAVGFDYKYDHPPDHDDDITTHENQYGTYCNYGPIADH